MFTLESSAIFTRVESGIHLIFYYRKRAYYLFPMKQKTKLETSKFPLLNRIPRLLFIFISDILYIFSTTKPIYFAKLQRILNKNLHCKICSTYRRISFSFVKFQTLPT